MQKFKLSTPLAVLFVLMTLSNVLGQQDQVADESAKMAELKAAVESSPDDVAARANYAIALFRARDLAGAWTQLRKGHSLQPDHQGISKGILTTLGRMEAVNHFAVGKPQADLLELLGEPDKKIDVGSRKRWVYIYLAFDFVDEKVHEVVDLRGATEALFMPTETISVDLDGRGWTCGYRKKVKGSSSAMYFLPEENVEEWTEKVDIKRILNAAGVGSMENIVQKMLEQIAASSPGIEHEIIDLEETSALLAIEYPAVEGVEKQHELVRIMKGPVDLHRIAYTIKVEEPTRETQVEWTRIFRAASLSEVKPKDTK